MLKLLPGGERERVLRHCDKAFFEPKQPVYRAGDTIRHVYFPLTGLLSVMLTSQDPQTIELLAVGKEGMVGAPLFLGVSNSPAAVVCQVPSLCLRMSASAFQEELHPAAALPSVLRRYTQGLINELSFSLLCNRVHALEKRMCRWLLTTHDRVRSNELEFTHESVSQMLGVRRATVTEVAGSLHSAGLIDYSRGRIRILDRTRLEANSCECYSSARKELESIWAEASSSL